MLLHLRGDYSASSEILTKEELHAYGRKRWRRAQFLAQEFWQRWRTHFLQNLQIRNKWIKERSSLEVGDLVLIRNKNAPRKSWPMGRIIEIRRGSDSLVRSAIVKHCHEKISSNNLQISLLERPISNLVLILKCPTI